MPSEFRRLIPKNIYDIYFNLTTEDRIAILQSVLEKNHFNSAMDAVSFIKKRRPVLGKKLEELVNEISESIEGLYNDSKLFLKSFSQHLIDTFPDKEEAINFERYKSFQKKFIKKFKTLPDYIQNEIKEALPYIQLVTDKNAMKDMINYLIVDN
uniref:Fatty-acid and retinol-binding protein 1 n=1 Tax=Parastrongyloides trichosuri TaxID=131310 RepID=A0A0N4ZU22_PARTI